MLAEFDRNTQESVSGTTGKSVASERCGSERARGNPQRFHIGHAVQQRHCLLAVTQADEVALAPIAADANGGGRLDEVLVTYPTKALYSLRGSVR